MHGCMDIGFKEYMKRIYHNSHISNSNVPTPHHHTADLTLY